MYRTDGPKIYFSTYVKVLLEFEFPMRWCVSVHCVVNEEKQSKLQDHHFIVHIQTTCTFDSLNAGGG